MRRGVGVLRVQRAVVALLVEVPVDLAEGVTGRRREDEVPRPGGPHAAPQALESVRVVAIAQLAVGDAQIEGPGITRQLPGTTGGVLQARAGTEPQLASGLPDHDPPSVFVRREVHAAAAEQIL
jgi:hypothetical protein